jgi:hypothetical protein
VALAGGVGLVAVVGPLRALRRSPPPDVAGDMAHVASGPGAEGRSTS